MKKLIFIMALCLLCGCFSGCFSGSSKDYGDIFPPPPPSFRFESTDVIKECYEALNQGEKAVEDFLKENPFWGCGDIKNKDDLQQMLTELEGYKFPCPMDDSPYRIKQLKYTPEEQTLEIVYQNEKLPNLEARAICYQYDPQWQPPQFAANEVVSTLQLNGKKIALKEDSISTSDPLYGYYADEQAQFRFEVDAEPNGGYDTSLSIDKFILTDLRTLLFGEE